MTWPSSESSTTVPLQQNSAHQISEFEHSGLLYLTCQAGSDETARSETQQAAGGGL